MKLSLPLHQLMMTCLLVFWTLSGFSQTNSPVQQGNKLVGTNAIGAAYQGYSVALDSAGNTAIVGGYRDNNDTGAVWIYTRIGSTWTQQAKLVGTGRVGKSQQGISVAISADGNTALVGGYADSSNRGAVWVFTRSGGTTWSQQGTKLVGSGAVGNSNQGVSVSLSNDGNTALVGGHSDNSSTGAAWVFTRSGTTWTQQGSKLVGTGAIGAALQGRSVALSGDGNTAMVGGYLDNSSLGAVWVFTRSGTTWTQQGTKLVGTGASGTVVYQGFSVSLSYNGNTAIVGGYNDNTARGASWVFTRSGSTWTQQGAKLVGSGYTGGSHQGYDVSLSSDGNTAIIGGDADNNNAGASWIFYRSGGTWTQQGNKLTGMDVAGTSSRQGVSVAISADAGTFLIGANGDNANAGAARVFVVTTPGSPEISSSTVSAGGATLNFNAPADGGGQITNYEYSTDSGNTWIARNPASAASPIQITGMTNCTAYPVQLRAVNIAGSGTPSAVVTIDPTPVITWAREGTGKQICSGVGNDTLRTAVLIGGSPVIQWYKVINGQNVALTNTAPYSGATTSQLVLTAPTDTADGTFFVTISNTLGGCINTSAQKTIVINPKPAVSISSGNLSSGNLCSLSSSVTFVAATLNVETPAYQWYKNDASISGATASSYQLSSPTANDRYKCTIAVGAPACAVSVTLTSNTVSLQTENTSANSWMAKSNVGVNQKQSLHGTFSIGNKGYMVAGTDNNVLSNSTWEFDPQSNVWNQKANMPGPASYVVSFAIGNFGYVINSAGNFYKYSPTTDSWTTLANVPFSGAKIGFSVGQKGFITGAGTSNKETWSYNPITQGWTKVNDYPTSNTFNAVQFVIGNYAYVGGGRPALGSNATKAYHKLDAATGIWSSIADIGTDGNGVEIAAMGSFSLGGYGYVVGGTNTYDPCGLCSPRTGYYTNALSYNHVANTWSTVANLPFNALTGGFAIGNKGYALNSGGSNTTTCICNNVNEYTPNGLSIKTGPISNTSLCLGSTFDVPYTLGCNTATSFAGYFIVQLSDTLGTFADPTEIGRIAATNGQSLSGNISATIPVNAKLSDQYRIRIVSESTSSPSTNTIGYMNDALISVRAQPSEAGTIGNDHTVPYPAELTVDSIKNITLANTSEVALSNANPYSWQSTTNAISGPWNNIANAGGVGYSLPLNARADTFYRRMANFACGVSVPSNIVVIKVFSAANGKLNGSISGAVKTPLGTGVAGIDITIQKSSVSLLGSPLSKVYSTVTGSDGKYIIPNIFYGDINNGDPASVSFLVKATRANHDIQNSAGLTAVLSNTNPAATNLDFTDYTVVSASGAVTTSMDGVNGGAMDSVNSVRINVNRLIGGAPERSDTTGSQGYGKYAITVVDQIQYRLTPVYKNHRFIPPYRDINMIENYSNIDFYDSTFNSISGVFGANGGAQIIGRAVLKFEDTVINRIGVKLTKIITTNTDGSYSITLPARKYKVTVVDFIPANNQNADMTTSEVLEFFNVRMKDSSVVDIDTGNAVKNLIYHRPPVLTFDYLPDSCNRKVFRQNVPKTFIVNIWEGSPIHNYKVATTDSTDSLRLVTNVTGDVRLDTIYYKQPNGSDTITLTGGSPNSLAIDNYLKTLKFDFTDRYGQSAVSLNPQTVVLGLKVNRGTFTTVTPEVPILILHAPPGDLSSSTWTQNTKTETEVSISNYGSYDVGVERSWQFGWKGNLGWGFEPFVESEVKYTGSLEHKFRIGGGGTSIISTTTSTSYSTNYGGDLYIGAAMNLLYAVADELVFNDTSGRACMLYNQSRMVVAPQEFATTYSYTEGHILSTLIPALQTLADNATDTSERNRFLNQVSVWKQVVETNKSNKAKASFKLNRSFDGDAGPITESTTNSTTDKNTLDIQVEVEAGFAAEVNAVVAGNGGTGKVYAKLKWEWGKTTTTTNTTETTTSYTLDDNDRGDYFSVDIKTDPVYGTPVFSRVAGASSCPNEEITQSRDMARLDIPEEVNGVPNKVQTNIPVGNEALYQLRITNLSESRETRTYYLEMDQSSNPNSAIVSIGGNNSFLAYRIPYAATQIVTVSVKKNPFSNVYSYENLRFRIRDSCYGDANNSQSIVSSSTLSAYFAGPCSNINLVSPADGWVANASGNNTVPVVFNGYTISNLQSVTLQYVPVGRTDWQTGFVLNQSAISPSGTHTAGWDISNITDGNYEIRLQLQCASGIVYSLRYTGVIDRRVPQFFGAPQPADRLLSLGDEISFSYDENIVTTGLNNDIVTLTKIRNPTPIPVLVSGYNNKINILPVTDLFASHYGDTLRVLVKNIKDLYGNVRTGPDTLYFIVGGNASQAAGNPKVRRVSLSNVNASKASVFENSGDSLMVKFKFDTASNTTSRTLVRFAVGGSAQYNSGYTISYSNGQTLATIYNGNEGTIVIPANRDSAILIIKPIADAVNEGDETIRLSLLSGGDYTISSNYQIEDTIKNDDNLGVPVINSSGGLCRGGSITLSTPGLLNGQAITAYEWKKGSVLVGTGQNLLVRDSGVYTVTVYNASRFSGTSLSYAVIVSPPPVSVSNVSVCAAQLPYRWNNTDYTASGTYSVTVSNAAGCDSIATLNLAVQQAALQGLFTTPNNDSIPYVKVGLTGATTADTLSGMKGQYSISACGGGSYVLTPSKNNDVVKSNGVSTFDIIKIQSHILNIDTLNSPYKIIAADVNNSGSVTNLDIIYLRRLILGIDTTFPGNRLWAFVDGSYSFPSNINPFPYPSSKSYNSLSPLTDQNFKGVKLGDVTYDWNKNLSRGGSVDTLEFYTDTVNADNSDSIVVQFKVRNYRNLLGLQFTLNWNPGVFNFSNVSSTVPGLQFGQTNTGVGKLTALWNDPVNAAKTLPDGTVFFELRVRKSGGRSMVTNPFWLSLDVTPAEVYDGYLNNWELILNARPINEKVETTPIAVDGIRLYPNPTSGSIKLDIASAVDEEADLRIFDDNGRYYGNRKLSLVSGNNSFTLDLVNTYGLMRKRIYFVRIHRKSGVKVYKVIIK